MAVNPILGLVGNEGLQQFFIWNIVSALVSAGLAPPLTAETQTAWKLAVKAGLETEITVPDLVDAVVKGHLEVGPAKDAAAAYGVGSDHFDTLVASAGQPLPLLALTEAWRRKLIPQSGTGPNAISLEQGIRESDLKNKWIPVVEALQFNLPPPGTVVEGWLRAQIDPAVAKDYLFKAGIDEATANLMFKAAGRPPSPEQLMELWRRGIIPETGRGGDTLSVEQGYLETDLKDKWLPIWKHLRDYIPPPRTVTAMVREGAMDDQAALGYFKDAGLSPELAAQYLAAAHHQRTAATKELAKSDILTLLVDELIPEAEATTMLEGLGYAAETAAFEIEIARFREANRLLGQVLTRLRTLYVAHKVDKPAAMAALDSLGLAPAARDTQLRYWDEARVNNVAILTPAQIGELVKLAWLSFGSGVNLLEGHGYSNTDAQLFLLAHLKLAPDAAPPEVTISPA